jgi:hypothetical protein
MKTLYYFIRLKRRFVLFFYKEKIQKNKYLRRKKGKKYIIWQSDNIIRFNNIKFIQNTKNELN